MARRLFGALFSVVTLPFRILFAILKWPLGLFLPAVSTGEDPDFDQKYDHYTDTIEDIKQLKREEKHNEVESLLLWCINQTEAEARDPDTVGSTPAPAYYRHLAIVYRKEDRYDDEVEVLERYLDVCDELGETHDEELVNRLNRARELAAE